MDKMIAVGALLHGALYLLLCLMIALALGNLHVAYAVMASSGATYLCHFCQLRATPRWYGAAVMFSILSIGLGVAAGVLLLVRAW